MDLGADRILDFHPNAERALNERAGKLITLLSREKPKAPTSPRDAWPEQVHTTPAEPIGPILAEQRDPTGRHGAIWWEFQDGTCLGLYGASYVHFLETVEAVHRTGRIRHVVSESFVREQLFEWLRAVSSPETPDAGFCEYLEIQSRGRVRRMTAFVPVHGLVVQAAFRLGRVTIQPMAERMFRQWQRIISQRPGDQEQKDAAVKHIEKLRHEHQGKAAVIFTTTGEPIRVQELAVQEAGRSLSVLRLFDRGVTRVDSIATCVPYGSQHQPSSRVLLLGEARLPTIYDGYVGPVGSFWRISVGDLRDFFGLALAAYDVALRKDDPSDWETDVLSSLALFTQGATKAAIADRLLYTFAALESLLLRDSREPLTQNIGDRLAFALENDPGARRQIVELVKDIYDARSRFVHHGEKVRDHSLVERCLESVWKFYVVVLPRAMHHRTKNDFINSLDAIKYS